MPHCHAHDCKHEKVEFCRECRKVYCKECKAEWAAPCTLQHWPLYTYTYPTYQMPTTTPGFTFSDTVTGTSTGICLSHQQ